MQRYFIEPGQVRDRQIVITGDDARHISRVMRSKSGDEVICCDGTGREYVAVLASVSDREVAAEISQTRDSVSEPKHRIWIAQSLPKGDKLETVIQKGTEIGATRFIPFISERTVVQYDDKKELKRLERWRKIAKEAAEQAHRGKIPSIDAPVKWDELLDLMAAADTAFICYEHERELTFKRALQQACSQMDFSRSRAIMLVVGPEGGFSEEEVQQAKSRGCISVSLGRRILRTETAAMVGLSFIIYEMEEA